MVLDARDKELLSKIKMILDHWEDYTLNFSITNNSDDAINQLMAQTFTNGKGSMPLKDFSATKYIALSFSHNISDDRIEFVASDKLVAKCIEDMSNTPQYVKWFLEQTAASIIMKEI